MWRKNNPKKVKNADKKWKSKNREKISAQKAKRRALSVGVKENFDESKRKTTFNKFGNRCFNCNSENNLTVDHHMPLSAGFPLEENNAVVLCRSCNSSKGTKLPKEFYTKTQLKELQNVLYESQ